MPDNFTFQGLLCSLSALFLTSHIAIAPTIQSSINLYWLADNIQVKIHLSLKDFLAHSIQGFNGSPATPNFDRL